MKVFRGLNLDYMQQPGNPRHSFASVVHLSFSRVAPRALSCDATLHDDSICIKSNQAISHFFRTFFLSFLKTSKFN